MSENLNKTYSHVFSDLRDSENNTFPMSEKRSNCKRLAASLLEYYKECATCLATVEYKFVSCSQMCTLLKEHGLECP